MRATRHGVTTVLACWTLSILSLAASGCGNAGTQPEGAIGPQTVGAQSAAGAVTAYFHALAARDFEAMGRIWGSRKQLARDRYSRAEFEKRVIITACYIGWKSYRIVDTQPGIEGAVDFTVESIGLNPNQDVRLNVVQGVGGRWFVDRAAIGELKPTDCASTAGSTG